MRNGPSNPLRLLMHVPVPWVFVLTYLVGVVAEYTWPPSIVVGNTLPGLQIAGGVLLAVGAAVAAWGLVTFRKARTTTVPGRASSALVTWGPYRFTRNPVYVGLTLAYLNWIVIPVEENKLREVFGESYENCRAKVRRWL